MRIRSDFSRLRFVHVLTASLAISACGGGGGGSSGGNNEPVNAAPTAVASTVEDNHWELLPVTLSAAASSDDTTSVENLQYAWTQIDNGAPSVTLQDADTVSAAFTATRVIESQDFVFRLAVTDEDGATDTAEITVSVKEDNWLAYVGEFDTAGEVHLYARRLSGVGDPIKLTEGKAYTKIEWPEVSPDRRWVAFNYTRDGHDGLAVANLEGTLHEVALGLKDVNDDGLPDDRVSSARWSSQGEFKFIKVVYHGSLGSYHREMHVAKPGETPRDVTGLAAADNESVWLSAWSPDGKFIAYSVEGRDSNDQAYKRLFSVDVATGERALLVPDSDTIDNASLYDSDPTTPVIYTADGLPDTDQDGDGIGNPLNEHFRWSNDSQKIACLCTVDSALVRDLVVVNRDGTNVRNISHLLRAHDNDGNGEPDAPDPDLDLDDDGDYSNGFEWWGLPQWSRNNGAVLYGYRVKNTSGDMLISRSRLANLEQLANSLLGPSGNDYQYWQIGSTNWKSDGTLQLNPSNTFGGREFFVEINPDNISDAHEYLTSAPNYDQLDIRRVSQLDVDGNRLLLLATADSVDRELFTLTSGDTENYQKLPIDKASGEEISSYELSPDLAHLLLTGSLQGGGLFYSTIDGSALTRLSPSTPSTWYADGGKINLYEWTPDSRHALIGFSNADDSHKTIASYHVATRTLADLTHTTEDPSLRGYVAPRWWSAAFGPPPPSP